MKVSSLVLEQVFNTFHLSTEYRKVYSEVNVTCSGFAVMGPDTGGIWVGLKTAVAAAAGLGPV